MTIKDDDVRTRLREAALGMFRERGFDGTTAAQIAARAGVTERTFFRYFPDKREVLFGGEARVRAALLASIADAPAELGPLDTLFRAFRSLEAMHMEIQPYLKLRHEVISATPALYEREVGKMAALADALAETLKARGVGDLRAVLAARTGMAAFADAAFSWLDDPTVGLAERLDLAFHELKELFAQSN